ncbi:MAG: hypothetical protein V1679_02830 [Candidatus Peregrinibacteria bacterium]
MEAGMDGYLATEFLRGGEEKEERQPHPTEVDQCAKKTREQAEAMSTVDEE